MRKLTKTFFSALTLCLGLQSFAYADDVSSWALPEYTNAIKEGLVTYNVISNNLKGSVTREEFCELSIALYERFTGDVSSQAPATPFSDSDNTSVSRAYFYGIVSGTSENLFEPKKLVTRQEMAKMLENTLNASEITYKLSDISKLALFDDASQISDWALPSVSVVTGHSIMNGSDGNFDPTGNATREQAILTAYRTYKTFAENASGNHKILCTSPSAGEVISDNKHRIECTQIANASDYFVIIKDADGNLVKNVTVSAPSAFKINSSTLPYGENYSLTVGAKTRDSGQIFSEPVTFSFVEPEVTEPVVTEPEVTQPTPVEIPIEEITPPVVITPPVPDIQTGSSQSNTTPQSTVVNTDTEIGYEDEVMSDKAAALIAEAEKYLGIPYVYGGTTPDGFDCSGFVKYVYEKFGVTLKRVSRDQYAYSGTKVSRSELQPGDLVFFGSNGIVGHVGIYTGNGQMIHSPSTGKTICYTSIETNYYKTRYIGAKRIF